VTPEVKLGEQSELIRLANSENDGAVSDKLQFVAGFHDLTPPEATTN
jgi:hypothetical protein